MVLELSPIRNHIKHGLVAFFWLEYFFFFNIIVFVIVGSAGSSLPSRLSLVAESGVTF